MENEFPRFENLPKLATRDKPLVLRANENERRALAKRAAIPALEFFETTLRVSPNGRGTFRIAGKFKARVTLVCSRSLKEFASKIDEDFSEIFITPDQYQNLADAGIEERDDYEVFEDENVDLGEMAAQLLILAIDPFPYLEGDIPEKIATSGVRVLSEEQVRAEKNPFAKLKNLQKKT